MSLTRQVDIEFKCEYFGNSTPCTAREVSRQRNGISGERFNVVRFIFHQDPDVELIGIIFEASKYVAVIDPANLDSHWRGDNFEAGLREVCRQWEKMI